VVPRCEQHPAVWWPRLCQVIEYMFRVQRAVNLRAHPAGVGRRVALAASVMTTVRRLGALAVSRPESPESEPPPPVATLLPHTRRAGVAPHAGQLMELSPAEDAMARVAMALRGSMRVTLAAVLETSGVGAPPVGAGALRAAVASLAAAHPVLRCTLVSVPTAAEGPAPAAAARRLSLRVIDGAGGGSAAVPVHVHTAPCGAEAGAAAQAVWREQIEKASLALGAPLARVDLVVLGDQQQFHEGGGGAGGGGVGAGGGTSGAHRCVVMLTVEHAFCDGQSIAHALHELLGALAAARAGDGVGKLVAPPVWGPSFEAAAAATLAGRGPSPQAQTASSPPPPPPPPPPPQPVARFPATAPGATPPRNAYHLAAASTTRALRTRLDAGALLAACRARGTTVTGALGACIIRGTADAIGAATAACGGSSRRGPLHVALACGADTRKLYTPPLGGGVLGYHVAGVPIFAADVAPDAGVPAAADDVARTWALAAAFRAHIAAGVDAAVPLRMAPMVSGMWAAALDYTAPAGGPPLTTSITNWGASPLAPTYGATTGAAAAAVDARALRLLDAFPLVNMSHSAFPVWLTTTAAGQLSLSLLTSRGLYTRGESEALLGRVGARLRTLASW
jgi:hypothetical protein